MRIPVVHCFDRNYVIPAAVSFSSMLAHADPAHEYALYVLHSDISDDDQRTLKEMVSRFPGATLDFVAIDDRFDDLFAKQNMKAHYSKEIFFKFIIPDLFPDEEKIVVTDVDVVFLDDISREFAAFDTASDAYFAGCRVPVRKGSWVDDYQKSYARTFSAAEMQALTIGAGFYIYNAVKLRRERMSERFMAFARENAGRLKQPEQDTINIICHPNVKLLSARTMVCTYCYDFYTDPASYGDDLFWNKEDVQEALNRPIQLHYATAVKPWTHPECTRSDAWYEYLLRTPFAARHLAQIGERLKETRTRRIFETRLPFSKTRRLVVSIRRD